MPEPLRFGPSSASGAASCGAPPSTKGQDEGRSIDRHDPDCSGLLPLGIRRADVPGGVAAAAVRGRRCRHRVGHDRRLHLHVRSGCWRPARRLSRRPFSAPHPAGLLLLRSGHRGLRTGQYRPAGGERPPVQRAGPPDRCAAQLRAAAIADPVHGGDTADADSQCLPEFRQCRGVHRHAVFHQYRGCNPRRDRGRVFSLLLVRPAPDHHHRRRHEPRRQPHRRPRAGAPRACAVSPCFFHSVSAS